MKKKKENNFCRKNEFYFKNFVTKFPNFVTILPNFVTKRLKNGDNLL